jgi:hypothetical protein
LKRRIDITGQRFGRLEALRFAGVDSHRFALWVCLCDCGTEKIIHGSHLRAGSIQSCGCLNRELSAVRAQKHGAWGTPEYISFAHAKARCTDSSAKQYADYGGRGIKFLFESFEQFFAELGPRPTAQHTLDRRNNDGHYAPGNVRWATRKEQASNRRKRK